MSVFVIINGGEKCGGLLLSELSNVTIAKLNVTNYLFCSILTQL